MKFYEDIIRKPVLSEKTYDMIGDKRYVFVVDRRANKVEIKKADRKSTRLNSSHRLESRMPSSA